LTLSPQAVHKQLKSLVANRRLQKIGKPPAVFYLLAESTPQPASTSRQIIQPDAGHLAPTQRRLIDERYLYISPVGQLHYGMTGFELWCEKTNQPIHKTAQEYLITLKKYDAARTHGLIDGRIKFQQTFTDSYLDEIFYIDFYSIERFGKTKLGQLLLHAKQSQSVPLMQQLVTTIRPYILDLIARYNIDAVGFIPPTVKRQTQLMTEVQRRLRLNLPRVAIVKAQGDATRIPVAQKTLPKLADRIENARRTIVVTERQAYKNILLIDDAVGSGATLHETAKKIKAQQLCIGTIIGLAITGSYKGFDVIAEV
jgi:hypothetical protein